MKRLSEYTSKDAFKKINESVEDRIDTQAVIEMLEKRYAEEVLQWYHYNIVADFLVGSERPNIEKTFKEMADDELNDHSTKILNRIAELGGDIERLKDFSRLAELSECKYAMPVQPYDTMALVTMNITHEKCAIDGYQKLLDLTRDKDTTTYDMAVGILADEEEHLKNLKDYLTDMEAKRVQ